MLLPARLLNALDPGDLRELAREVSELAREIERRAAWKEERVIERATFRAWLGAQAPPRGAVLTAQRRRRDIRIMQLARAGYRNRDIAAWLAGRGHGKLTPAYVGAIVRREKRHLDRTRWWESDHPEA